MLSETRYALNGDLHVAYRTMGHGPRNIVFVSNWFVSVEAFPEIQSIKPWLDKMTTLGRMIFFDQPGTGASDPVASDSPPTLEQWADSITCVLDALEAQDAALITIDGSFATGALFAATYPTRTTGLIALEAYAGSLRDASTDVSGLGNLSETAAFMLAHWGTGALQRALNPDMPWNEEIRAAWAKQERLAASPRMVAQLLPLATNMDVTGVLPAIRIPTLVVHHRDDPLISVDWGRQIAHAIPNAKMVEIPGRNSYPFVEPGWRRCFEEISEFLTGTRGSIEDDRVLATVLFTDIVDSTRRAAEMGDRDWRALLDAHDAVVRAQLSQFRGREVSTSGDSFLATFDGPQRAIRCALAVKDAVRALGIEVRAGLHTGECEVRGSDVGGIAVHIGARVSALAGPGEILVSGTLRDLVVGSGIAFEDRGTRELKGVPGEWRLFAVAG